MNTGIYSIVHVDSGRRYIGSAVHFDQRWRVHRCQLRKGTHHSRHLQTAWNKYGEGAFLFKRMLVCAKDDLIFYEQRLVDGFKAADGRFGFNASPVVGSRLGMKHTDEARAKIKAKRATQVFSEATRKLLSERRKGRKMPDWFGAFTSKHKTGSKHTPEAKAKISAAQTGKPQTLQRIERRTGGSADLARQICAEYEAGGISQTALAKKHGIDQSTVSRMVHGKRWGRFINQPPAVIKE